MSIYFKGMKVPKCCGECPVFYEDVCAITAEWKFPDEFDAAKERLPGCPAVPVAPHGRLGDLDAIMARCKDEKGVYFGRDCAVIGEAIESAPTIIPADPAEEDE